MEHAIVFDRVEKRYGAVESVRGLSFTVGTGEMFGLIGPDGAGKTTTIRLICGLLRADAGSIRVIGLDPIRQHRKLSQSIGYLSQRFSLYGDLSVDENIAFFAEIHGLTGYQPRRDRLLEMTQLTPFRDRLADRLSGGMKQKLALACTLVHEPSVIVLDEPTTGVDPVSRREFWKLLSEFQAQGITLLHQGRLLALDAPVRLSESLPGSMYEVIAVPQRLAAEVLAATPGVAETQAFGERIHVRTTRADAAGQAALDAALRRAGIVPSVVRPVPASLEDVFISRVAGASESGGRSQDEPV